MIEIIPNWHPVFVHFTVALVIISAAIHLLSHFLPHSQSGGELANQLTIVARWNLWLGVGFTLLTVAAGWYAYNTVAHDAPSHLAMTEHRNWAMLTLALLLGIAGWEYYLSRRGRGKGWLFTGLLVIAAGLLLSTAWRGSELVYRYGLGVMSLPKSEGPGHPYEHGDMPVHSEAAPHSHDHEDAANGEHPHDAEPGGSATEGAGAAHQKSGHTHAPGTPPHKD